MDTIGNLPAHPLIVHAAVVLTPLAAIALLLYAVIAQWRTGLKWPTLALAAVGAVSGLLAEESGEKLQRRLSELGNNSELIGEHVEVGGLAAKAGVIVLVAAVLVILVISPTRKDPTTARSGLSVLLTLAAGGVATYLLVMAGHSGATAVWDGIVQGSGG